MTMIESRAELRRMLSYTTASCYPNGAAGVRDESRLATVSE
jgi:hypothetical protein